MKFNKNDILKYTSILFFTIFIFAMPLISIFTEDKSISTLENKILQQLPRLSFDNVLSGKFMKEFDSYTNDQFPFRSEFIKIKNSYSYCIGNREFRNIYVANGKMLEKFILNEDILNANVSSIYELSNSFKNNHDIDSTLMIIPTSIAFYEDFLPSYSVTDKQDIMFDKLKDVLKDSSLKFYTPYYTLLENKDKYIYFNTDHHWTQLGASLAFDDMYNTNISNSSTYTKVSDKFYGTYYSKAILPNVAGDSIYSYREFNNFDIQVDFSDKYDTLYSPLKLEGKNKYQYFLHGDPSFAVIDGNKNLDKEIIIFKDSFAHNFIPMLTLNYSKIHVVDPRYYSGDINEYISSNNITEALFIHNIQTLNEKNIYKNFK